MHEQVVEIWEITKCVRQRGEAIRIERTAMELHQSHRRITIYKAKRTDAKGRTCCGS